MTIEYMSDTHFDFWFRPLEERGFYRLYDRIFSGDADVIVIAGDLGHYNHQSLKAMKLIRKKYCKHLVCVLGNHDYYLSKKEKKHYQSSFERANAMKSLLKFNGIHCLDGNAIEIGGVRFGGAMGWYDGMYAREHFQRQVQGSFALLEGHWQQCMNDFRAISNIDYFRDLWEIEQPKIEKVYTNCDVMITHVNPSINKEHTAPEWRKDLGTAFFTFDGKHYMKSGSMTHWIYGHTHTDLDYEIEGVKVTSCQLGYPGEFGGKGIHRAKRICIAQRR